MIQAQDMRAEIERLKKPRQHPVKVGEYVKNDNGDVCQVHEVYAEEYLLNTGWTWAFENCTPCDPPTASHDTPAGKETAQAAARPKPGDVVRLVRVPTVKDCSKYDFQDSEQLRLISTQVNTMGKVVGTELCDACACVVDDTGTIKAWPLSCIEVVKGGDK
jgi:hypothetical protein